MSQRQRELRIVELLGQVLELQGKARHRFLDRTCAADPELRQELESLLEEEDTVSSDFLLTPPFERPSQTTTVLPMAPGHSLDLGPLSSGELGAKIPRPDDTDSPIDPSADLEQQAAPGATRPRTPGAWRTFADVRQRRAAAAILMLLALVAGLIATSLALLRIRRAEAVAVAEAGKARLAAETSRQVIDVLLAIFKVTDPGDGDGNAARSFLDAGASRILGELEHEPRVQAALAAAFGKVYFNLGLDEQATPLLVEALSLRQQLLPEDDLGLAESLHDLSRLYVHQNDFDSAEPLTRQALARRRELFGNDSLEVADTLVNLGRLLIATSRFEEAATRLDKALAIFRRELGGEHRTVADTLELYGSLLVSRQQPESALFVLRESLAMMTRLLGKEHPRVAEVRDSLARALTTAGDPAAAERLLRQSVEPVDGQETGDAKQQRLDEAGSRP